MSDDEANAHDLQRANQAQLILENPMLTETFTEQKRQLLEYWEKQTKSHETAERERLWQAYQIVGMLEAHFKSIVSNGRMAAAHVKLIAKMDKTNG